jgi:hypothetical protein
MTMTCEDGNALDEMGIILGEATRATEYMHMEEVLIVCTVMGGGEGLGGKNR